MAHSHQAEYIWSDVQIVIVKTLTKLNAYPGIDAKVQHFCYEDLCLGHCPKQPNLFGVNFPPLGTCFKSSSSIGFGTLELEDLLFDFTNVYDYIYCEYRLSNNFLTPNFFSMPKYF